MRASLPLTMIATGLLAVSSAPVAHAATATRSATNPVVGALFDTTSSTIHGCTASVVTSSTQDLIVTAAHCLHGNGAGMKFVPGYAKGQAPYGTWTSVAAYVPSTWKSRQNPRADVAVLRLAKQKISGTTKGVAQVVGSNAMATSPVPSGLNVTVPGYATGSNDTQLSCTNAVTISGGYPTFSCNGYGDGVSGSPFLSGGKIWGVVGGLHQGGCATNVSYSSDLSGYGGVGPYLITRATNGSAPDASIPYAGSDGC